MIKKAYLAGGCFWGLEELFCKQKGILNIDAGYTGGKVMMDSAGLPQAPTYESHTGYAEALEIEYDDSIISYKQLLDFFFQIHNPTTLNRQGNDIGTSYRSAIFYQSQEEKREGEEFIDIVNKSKRWKDVDGNVMPVVTTLESFTKFYKAEDYHQDYLQKNPTGYTCHAIYFDSYLK